MKVLLEMRPALGGHSGIPQETRLLYRGLTLLEGVQVIGLLQSGNLVLEEGLPRGAGRVISQQESIDRLSRIVVSLQQGPASTRLEWLRRRLLLVSGPVRALLLGALGVKVPLTVFRPENFRDYVWRGLFAKSLPAEDFPIVTRGEHWVMRWPWSAMNALGVVTGAMGRALYPRLDTRGCDVLLVETPYPGRPATGTQLVVRYHDAFPLLMPHTVKDRGYHRAMHFRALQRNARDGAWFACVSDATRTDLLSVIPDLEARAVTIPNMVSHHFFPDDEPADRVPEIIWSRRNRQAPHEGGRDFEARDRSLGPWPYLLAVSTLEPRKNHQALLDAWELLRSRGHPDLQLVCVGSMGWEHGAILDRFGPWLRRGGLHLLHDVPADDLRLLYRHAAATVCPSFAEGFDFSGVEAMRSGGLVVASDIPVHREIYAEAGAYFNAYAPAELASTLAALLAPAAADRRAELRQAGDRIAKRYLPAAVLPQWQAFLDRVAPPAASR